MKFIPRKSVNTLFPFAFHKQVQKHMPDLVSTNSAFSTIYLAPNRAPKNSKAQKKLFNKYDLLDENLKEFRKNNFLEIGDETYLVIGTVVKREDLLAYNKGKGMDSELKYVLSNPGQILVQIIKDGKNILTPEITDDVIKELGEVVFSDESVHVYTNIQNIETYEMDLEEVSKDLA